MSTVKKCLGPVLYQEAILLDAVLNDLLIRKHSDYVDALNCQWMFKNCATLIGKGGN